MTVRLNAKLFSTRGTRRAKVGVKRLWKDEDREFPEALHIDLGYVFNGSDRGIEESVLTSRRDHSQSRPAKIIDFVTRDGLRATLDYFLSAASGSR